jgi:iron(III) transport system substrate-binding protein
MHTRISKRTVLAVTVIAATLVSLVAASASPARPTGQTGAAKSPPPSPIKGLVASLKGLSPEAREQKLYEGAKAEGALKWYTTLSRTISPAVAKAFETKYPGIKIELYRASSEDVTARLYQEANSNTAGADVVETNGTELLFMQHRKNITIPYRDSPYAKEIPASYRFDTFTGDRIEYFISAWNTNIVKAGQEPKSWQDMTDPKWKGLLSMEPGDVDWYAAVYQALENTAWRKLKPKPTTAAAKAAALKKIRAPIDAMWAGMARNSQIISGHTTQATLLAAGQFGVCVSCHAQSVVALKLKKAPLDFKPYGSPLVIRAQGIGIVYRLQHPNAALLFYDWMLRKDGGQKELLAGGAAPAHPELEDVDLRGGIRFRINLRPIVANFGFWADKYDRVMQLGSKKP